MRRHVFGLEKFVSYNKHAGAGRALVGHSRAPVLGISPLPTGSALARRAHEGGDTQEASWRRCCEAA